ncbi:DUF4382 domain-containing protein [Flammeovirga yaeyamensis]|uniref:DUF4382 domain-containing protein n=1 Tax=Flammeovirga yaeyamensis TaxID=367791 RepID=A0AAX1N9X5_9BACT|nr:DUF4382 domain-containing protein [Flammeovirga yaeyamensis]MBB3699335.1 hypothetical protein [Flammeovirga yaeyamensis]NMF35404.1 DUF4382 domain-containing protein [Flammeovirga yaeyamensis]QWG04264.1 DUF4382 domain-containing protein [Flammeovirga yaeyamensis]
MKKVLLSVIAITTILFSSCNNDDSPTSNARTDVSLKSGGISPLSGARTTATDIPGIDSVVVSVESLTVEVNDQTVTFYKQEGEGMIDLLHFQSQDTIMWTEETLPLGEVHGAVLGLDKKGLSYVIETDNDEPVDLHIAHKALDFRVESDSAIAANTKYILKLDMDGSLRLVETGAGKYNLQQGTAGTNPEGIIVIEKVN